MTHLAFLTEPMPLLWGLKLLPMVSGLLLKKEIDFLDGVIKTEASRPLSAGLRSVTKSRWIANLMEKADVIMIGGGMGKLLCRGGRL